VLVSFLRDLLQEVAAMAKVAIMTKIRKGLCFDFMMMILSFEAKLVVGYDKR
jgi:hypothetical protein